MLLILFFVERTVRALAMFQQIQQLGLLEASARAMKAVVHASDEEYDQALHLQFGDVYGVLGILLDVDRLVVYYCDDVGQVHASEQLVVDQTVPEDYLAQYDVVVPLAALIGWLSALEERVSGLSTQLQWAGTALAFERFHVLFVLRCQRLLADETVFARQYLVLLHLFFIVHFLRRELTQYFQLIL